MHVEVPYSPYAHDLHKQPIRIYSSLVLPEDDVDPQISPCDQNTINSASLGVWESIPNVGTSMTIYNIPQGCRVDGLALAREIASANGLTLSPQGEKELAGYLGGKEATNYFLDRDGQLILSAQGVGAQFDFKLEDVVVDGVMRTLTVTDTQTDTQRQDNTMIEIVRRCLVPENPINPSEVTPTSQPTSIPIDQPTTAPNEEIFTTDPYAPVATPTETMATIPFAEIPKAKAGVKGQAELGGSNPATHIPVENPHPFETMIKIDGKWYAISFITGILAIIINRMGKDQKKSTKKTKSQNPYEKGGYEGLRKKLDENQKEEQALARKYGKHYRTPLSEDSIHPTPNIPEIDPELAAIEKCNDPDELLRGMVEDMEAPNNETQSMFDAFKKAWREKDQPQKLDPVKDRTSLGLLNALFKQTGKIQGAPDTDEYYEN